jgi:geranylgeranyl pyrophosphate synthase
MSIEKPLRAVNELLLSVTESSVPLLTETSAHILRAGGKRLRPRLVLLAHAAAGGTDTGDIVPLAAAVEIIHTATLVHDDINDNGTLRRGRETVNSRWGGTFALLTGDFLFAKTYEIMTPYSRELNQILARASRELVEGETLQIKAARDGKIDQATYFEIISKKTASLFMACAELGATAAQAPQEWIDALRNYAFHLGLAFQIIDDVLDLVADSSQLGKNAGVDVAQGRGISVVVDGGEAGAAVAAKPAITLDQDTAPAPFKEGLLQGESLEKAIRKGHEKAKEYAQRAIDSLTALPDSAALDELGALARTVIERDH